MACVVLDVSEFMIIRAVEFTTLKETRASMSNIYSMSNVYSLRKKLENIPLIELRRNELDKPGGTKFFTEGLRAHEVLEERLEEF